MKEGHVGLRVLEEQYKDIRYFIIVSLVLYCLTLKLCTCNSSKHSTVFLISLTLTNRVIFHVPV